MTAEKFIPPLIDFIGRNFDKRKNKFVLITSEKYLFGLTPEHNVEFLHTDSDFVLLKEYMHQSTKIILHGLWRDKVDDLLLQYPRLLNKCYWIMWGGDFYFPELQSKNRHAVIKNMGFLVSEIDGDVSVVREQYGATGTHIKCLAYLSNVFYEPNLTPSHHSSLNIQIGNSAGETNNHDDILFKLHALPEQNFNIYCPLSYGPKQNALRVKELGLKLFGDRYFALESYMNFDDYSAHLATMDYAIFNAERQQSFGNMIYLIGLGKKVFINDKSTLLGYFQDIGIAIFNASDIDLSPLSKTTKAQNKLIVRSQFTEQRLKQTMRHLAE